MLYLLVLIIPAKDTLASNQSIARKWNEAMLFSIRRDFARPTIHARNIFHVSIAMYDAWAAFDTTASPYFLGRTHGTFTCPYNGILQPTNIQEAQEKAISYASYRLLKQRFQFSPNASLTLLYYDSLMNNLGYPIDFFSQDYSTGDPAALGNYIAAKIIEYGFTDGSNQQNNYVSQYYQTVNPPIVVNNPGNSTLVDPNRWQQVFLDQFIDQSGNPISISPPFLSPEWGNLQPFALNDSHKTTYERDGNDYHVFMDQLAPPYIDTTVLSDLEDPYKWGFTMVSVWQSHLDPTDDVMWDISPASIGNNPSLPETAEEYPNFYNFIEGGDQSQGWTINPTTGLPYAPQLVKRGDYARVLAEFWADGPNSETPPGHWFSILNYVSDHPQFEKRWAGDGAILSDLDWDVKSYLTLAGGMHDAAICAWSAKGWYDYPRPVSIVRWMAEKGQSTDPGLPRFNNAGIPLIPGKVELVMPGDPLAGPSNENLYKIKLYTWKGHAYIEDPEVDVAGVDWILAENWWTYQRPTFVTPPFAGYISGHSTFSRTAAEIMTQITGDNYFPGGMGEFHAGQNSFLHFEEGPSQEIVLQWATYQDASDQCSLSRIWGGIHPPQDDIPGRKIGIELGPLAFNHARSFIEAGVPHVVNASINHTLITDENINDIALTVEYNEAMDQTMAPTIDFSGNNIEDVFEMSSFEWTDAQTCLIHFMVNDLETETQNIGLVIKEGKDEQGVSQRIFIMPEYIAMDTKNPMVTISNVNYTVINTELTGNSTVEVLISYDQEMDTNSVPLVEFVSPVPVISLSENLATSAWIDENTFAMYFDVADLEEQCPDVIVNISGGKDLNGNIQNEAVLSELLQIDTKRPMLEVLSASAYLIDQETVQNGENFSIIASFDEIMNVNFSPEISLNGGAGLNNILIPFASGSGWLNPFMYRSEYSINPLPYNIQQIEVVISQARDFAGNLMEDETKIDYFEIELDPTSNGSNLSVNSSSRLFPNPILAGQPLNIKSGLLHGDLIVEIINQSGKLVFVNEFNSNKLVNGLISIQTSELSAGIYSARIISDDRTEVLQLVVVQ